jgi:protein-S-isoprenylcysteine O-methyltransferase Ste14
MLSVALDMLRSQVSSFTLLAEKIMVGKHILLTLIVGGAIGVLLWQRPPVAWTALPTAGLSLLIVGFILWTVARFQLGASFAVKAEARQLVTRGLYSKIRNPIYVFGSMVVAGGILVFGKPLWLLIFLLVIPLQIWRTGKESAVLGAAFGDEYRKYRAGTWF